MKILSLVLPFLLLLHFGCSSQQETLKGLSYDPPGSVVTTDKEIELQHRRTISFASTKVFSSNEFDGGKLNDFYQVNDTLYTAEMNAENVPINNSAWFAFKLWSPVKQSISILLKYKDGTHRYYPKMSRDKINWTRVDSLNFSIDTANGTALVRVDISPDTLWLSAQELFTSSKYYKWIDDLAEMQFVKKEVIGTSALGKPIVEVEITETNKPSGLIYVIGRQHPPEVTGALALKSFVETLTGGLELAKEFRKKYKTVVIPLVNPDGVDMGHWRHNSNGVDLNRDWVNFNQKETRLVKEKLLSIREESNVPVLFCIDFHSTQKDVFYITNKDAAKQVDEIYNKTMAWFEKIKEKNPGYFVNIDASLNNPSAPTSDSWMFNTFNCPALTYELGDETLREEIKQTSSAAAEAMMELLLKNVK
ncbi:MAG: hypothetical protein K8H86_09000 [Ignavibacteriaceae bacterium]|nr:hypothetical protein [Ignavibacteriaceae bacterium]